MNSNMEDLSEMGQKAKCLSCGAPIEGLFCGECHTFLPLSEEKDYFTILQVERRPYLDLQVLKQNFLKLSEMVHPDKYFNASPEVRDMAMKYASLINKAYTTLKDPKERLKYIVSLEMERDAPVSTKASLETMEFFIEASDICNEADRFIKSGNKNPDKRKDLLSRLKDLQKEAERRWNRIMDDIKDIDKEWMNTPANKRRPLVGKLLTISHELSYLSKLKSLINEAIIELY